MNSHGTGPKRPRKDVPSSKYFSPGGFLPVSSEVDSLEKPMRLLMSRPSSLHQ